ncbi:MAG: hypothetical protein HYX27_02730 [Acidobacteria bacterium]|nr:hypothetical protein [Acidobacteriota bacterium]
MPITAPVAAVNVAIELPDAVKVGGSKATVTPMGRVEVVKETGPEAPGGNVHLTVKLALPPLLPPTR